MRTFEIYGALLNGGCLVLTSKDTLLNPVQLGQTIVNQQVNTMWLTSSFSIKLQVNVSRR